MALKVVAGHRLDEALTLVAGLQEDPVARVGAGASRALAHLSRGGQ